MFTTFSSLSPGAHLNIDASPASPGAVRVAVAGEIDLSTAALLHVGLLGVLSAQHPDRIEVDLAGVTFMDCTGLTVLVVVGQAAARAGCRLRITNPGPMVRRVLELTGLFGVLAAEFDQVPHVRTTADVTALVDDAIAA